MKKEKARKYLRFLGYGTGAFGMDLSYGLFFTFLNKYQTDILLLTPRFLAVIATLCRIWDGVNDPMMGAVVDNTVSRFGKYRGWILLGAVLNAGALSLLFWNPGFPVTPGAMSAGLCIYAALTCVLWDVTNTLMDIPFWSMVPSLTTDPRERNIAATIPRAFSGLGNFAIVLLTVPMIERLGGQEGLNATGFHRWASLCGLVLVGMVTITFFSTRKMSAIAVTPPPKERFTFRTVVRTIRGNDQLLVFMLVALLNNTGWYMVSGLAAYYFEDVLGNLRLMSLFGTLVGAGQALGLGMLPLLTRRLERNTVIKLAMGMTAAGYLGMYLFSAVINVFPLFMAFGFLGMMGVGCCFVSQTVMLSDVVDYGEYKLGYRSDSVVFSMKGFLQKGAYSLQALMMYIGLDLTGYDGALARQSSAAKTGITVMMFLVPPLLTLAALALFSWKYKLDRGKMEEVTAAQSLRAL